MDVIAHEARSDVVTRVAGRLLPGLQRLSAEIHDLDRRQKELLEFQNEKECGNLMNV